MLYELLITSHLKRNTVALTDTVEDFDYKQIDSICGKISTALRNMGICCGERVVVIVEKKISTVLIMLSCIRSGICIVPISPDISEHTAKIIIDDCTPTLIIGNVKWENDTEQISEEELIISAKNINIPSSGAVNDKIVYILYTSGSTGVPKGVVAPEENVEFCIRAINERLSNSIDDRILCCMPLSFDYGLYQIFLSLASGACAVLPPEMPIPQIVTYLIKQKITGFPAMPAMLQMLLRTRLLEKSNLNHLRYITSTGDILPVSLISKLLEIIPNTEIIPMYGLTECKRVSIMPIGRYDKIMQGSCGLPLDGVEVWTDKKTDELIVCGKNVMDGYWNSPELTSTVYFTDVRGRKCLHTGDRFYIDDEGFLFFIGRIKDILKVNGYRIGAAEVEELLYMKMNDIIDEICIFGIPDEVMGEKIAVCVRTDHSEDEVFERVSQISKDLSIYQRPHFLYCTSAPLPRNQNGKIDKKKIKQLGVHNGYKKLK